MMARRGKPKKATVEAKRLLVRGSARGSVGRVRDLEKRLTEALARQTTGEILRVISGSPVDVRPIVRQVVRLRGGRSGILDPAR